MWGSRSKNEITLIVAVSHILVGPIGIVGCKSHICCQKFFLATSTWDMANTKGVQGQKMKDS